MKKFTKVIALILSLTLLICFPIGVSAAETEDTGVDTAAKGSLTIYKVDLTSAEKDGAWDSSYVSTGVYDQILPEKAYVGLISSAESKKAVMVSSRIPQRP